MPLRSMSRPWMAWAIIALRPVQNTAACTDTSTNWASPVCRRRSWATIAPSAPSTAAWYQVWGTVMRTGRRSGSPLSAIEPPIAASVRSVARWSAYGPVCPNGEMATYTRSGRAARSASKPRPRASITPGPAFSNTKSALATRARRSRRPASSSRSSTTLRLPRLKAWKRRLARAAGSPSTSGASARDAAPPGGSTLITSAPRPASTNVASSARPSVRSRTRYGASIVASVTSA